MDPGVGDVPCPDSGNALLQLDEVWDSSRVAEAVARLCRFVEPLGGRCGALSSINLLVLVTVLRTSLMDCLELSELPHLVSASHAREETFDTHGHQICPPGRAFLQVLVLAML